MEEEKAVVNLGGRPTKLTELMAKKLEEILHLDVSNDVACAHVGIYPSTMYDWIKKDPAFADRIATAKSYGRIAAGKTVLKSIVEDENVDTAKWYLEKKHKDEFGSGPMVAVQNNNINNISSDDLSRILEE